MMDRFFLTSVAVAALAGGAAFAQSRQAAPQGEQQPAAEQEVGGAEVQLAEPDQAPASECAARMDEVAGREFFVGPEAGYRQHVEVLGGLRDAAMQLQAENLDEACLRVVEAMEIAIETYQEAETPAGIAARGELAREQLEERLVPVDASQMPINTARLEGTDLYNLEGQDIGDVEGFLMSQGSPTHMLVSHGGFWSLGDEDAAIPLDIVRWDPEWQAFFAPMTDEQLDEAPAYDEGAWDGNANDEYYAPLRG